MAILERADELRSSRTPFALATVVRVHRPTSARTGDRALILPDGTVEGFVGGACAESTVRAQGLKALSTGESTLLRISPAEEPDAEEEGFVAVTNPCLSGGTLEIFLEAVVPPPLVCVHGDGPVARALAEVGAALGYDMRAGDPPDDAAAVVVAAHGRDEERVLTAALRAGVPYVGLVASVRRGAAVVAGLAAPDADRIRTPAGLDIGARTPQEIALSVFAQIIAERPAPRPAPVRAVPPVTGTAVDPVCGMSADTGPSYEHAGRVWRFCGPGCRDAFAADPARYTM